MLAALRNHKMARKKKRSRIDNRYMYAESYKMSVLWVDAGVHEHSATNTGSAEFSNHEESNIYKCDCH